MKTPTIAIDIDDVLVDRVMAIQTFLNDRFASDLNVSHMQPGESFFEFAVTHLADQANRLQLSEVIEKYVCGSEYMSLPPFDMAVDVVGRLAQTYDLIAVSQRPKAQQGVTLDWLHRYFANSFKEVVFVNEGHFGRDRLPDGVASKAAFCHDRGYDYLIDDRLKTCRESAKYGIRTILFGRYPWNAPVVLPPDIVRVENWRSIEELFENEGQLAGEFV